MNAEHRSPMRPRHVGFGLGLAALTLLPAWDAVSALPPHARSLAAVAWMAVGSLAIVLTTEAMLRARGSKRWLGLIPATLLAWMLVETALFALDATRMALSVAAGSHYKTARTVLLSLFVVAAFLLLVRVRRHGLGDAKRLLAGGVTLFAPLPLVVLSSWMPPVRNPDAPNIPRAATRTVVLIFDELDKEMLAMAGQNLPNFARLQSTSFSASQMFSPANYTSESLPAMLSGEDYEEATYTMRDILVLRSRNERHVRLNSRPNLLDDNPAQTRVVGWHLPYCTAFHRLRGCWDDAAYKAPGTKITLPEWWLGHSALVTAISTKRLARFTDVREFARHFFDTPDKFRLAKIGDIFAEQRQGLLTAIRDESAALVFGHLACPHPPSLKRRGDGEDVFDAYLSNLIVCDQTLGTVYDELSRRGGRWRLIVTSDHWFRGLDWLQSGKPLQSPQGRRTVPFWVVTNHHQNSGSSTNALTNSRVLPALVRASADPGFDEKAARLLIDAAGDGVTRLRPF